MLSLPPIPDNYDYEHVVVCGLCFVQKEVIAAGRSFFEKYEQREVDDAPTAESEEGSSEPELYRTESKRNKKKEQFSGNALRLSNLVKDVNLYKLLGVSESCSGDDVKKSYRKLVLEKHPDKLGQFESPAEEEKARAEFLQIQEAFEVLSDERNRRMYDSSLPCDDTIPSEKQIGSPADFFGQFGDAFRRNERWSVVRPIPELGSEESDRASVEVFYDFWFNKFESWRDFSHHDEHDLKQSESRDERRWMEVQNARIRKKRIAEEVSRVRRLVDLAYKLDPRVRRFKQEDLDEVAEQKRKRFEEKHRKENEKKAELETAKAAKELLAQQEVERVKFEKTEIKRIRAEIRQVLGINTSPICPMKIEKFNNALINYLTSLEKAEALLAKARDFTNSVEEYMDEVLDLSQPLSRASSAPPTPAPVVVSSTSTEWTAEELQLLTRGMQKYPVGTSRRWEVIQSLIGNRSVVEIIDMAKVVGSKKVIEPQALITSKKKAALDAEPDVDYEKQAAASPVIAPVAAPIEEWTSEQQAQLENAMRTTSTSLPPAERWSQIAAAVDGKTKQQCVARFKYIRELIAKKK